MPNYDTVIDNLANKFSMPNFFNMARGLRRWKLKYVVHQFLQLVEIDFGLLNIIFSKELIVCFARNLVTKKLYTHISISLLCALVLSRNMRGRWASAAIGAGIARNRAQGEAQQQINAANQSSQMEMERMKAQHQQEMDQLRASQAQARPQQSAEDPMAKLKKLADLKQQGILSEEEFQKMKAALIAKL